MHASFKETGESPFKVGYALIDPTTPDPAGRVLQRLLELAARGIADATQQYCVDATEIFLCGGGARNLALRSRLQELCEARKIALTDDLGIGVDWVEAAAFAWLAKQTMEQLPGNLPAVTGAQGPRILGVIYPA